jgi:hypothetical protein
MAQQLVQETKSWHFKFERLAKGVVRITCHSDDIDDLINNWEKLYARLESLGEKVEKV